MKKLSLCILLLVLSLMFVVGCGKSTSLEGKVVDGKGQFLTKVKVAAKMSQPLKGYEQFETTTGADGSFKFGKLFPTSEYQLILYSERGAVATAIKIESGPEGQTKMLPEPVMIRFMDYKEKEGVVFDTKTNLMWAAKDNGSGINWANAKSYCENYRGGGYSDWRMPTQDELAELYASGAHEDKIKLTEEERWVWASEKRGIEPALFSFDKGKRLWGDLVLRLAGNLRALPVRSIK